MQLDANLAGGDALGAVDVRIEVPTVTGEPLALVDEPCVLGGDRCLETGGLGVEH